MIAGAAASLLRDFKNRKSLVSVGFALVFGATALFPSPRAAAASPELYVDLRYEVEGPASRCWDEAELRRSVAKMVRYDPFRAESEVHVVVHVGGTSRAVDGRVEWRNARGDRIGERRFSAKDGNCIKLLTEMSFAVGLQIELLRPKPNSPEVSTGTSAPSRATTPPVGSSDTQSPPKPTQPNEEGQPFRSAEVTNVRALSSRPGSRSSTWVGGGPALALGVAPSLTGHARLFLGVRRDDFSAELGAEGTLPVSERRGDGSGFREHFLGVGAALCAHRALFSACVLGKVSALSVTGFGVDVTRSPNSLLMHTGLRVAATWPLAGRWFAVPHFDTLWLLTPRAVELNRLEMWTMPRLAGLAGIDVAARFP